MIDMSEETTTQEVEQEETTEQPSTGDTLESVEDYKEALKAARKDAAKYRTRSKEYDDLKAKADKYEQAIKMLNGDGDPDPDKLKSEVESARAEAQKAELENKVIRLASKYKADDELLIAHLDRKGLLNEDDLEASVKQALEDKPSLKLQGAVNTGDTKDGGGTSTKADFNKFIRSKLR